MKSILIVEDESSLADMIGSVLEAEGYHVTIRLSAEEGLSFCKTHVPDLIVSDVKMGEMDGVTLLEKIRSNKRLKSVPFVFLTAASEMAVVEKAKSLGAQEYIIKPVDLDDLLKAIKRVLPP